MTPRQTRRVCGISILVDPEMHPDVVALHNANGTGAMLHVPTGTIQTYNLSLPKERET